MGERILWMASYGQPVCSCLKPNHTTEAVLFAAPLIMCPRDKTLTHVARADLDRVYMGHSQADALVAFYAAEEALLRGDA